MPIQVMGSERLSNASLHPQPAKALRTWQKKLSRTSLCDRIKPEPEKDLLLLGVQKLESPDVFNFLKLRPWRSDVEMNSPSPFNCPDDKELNTLLKWP